MAKISFRVNGKNQTVNAEPDMPLLYALRNDRRLNGPKSAAASLSAAPAPSSWRVTPFARVSLR
jgi:aerobic-type carbon monoxide dehydrogenase small subunit (CoxS/CutS family)